MAATSMLDETERLSLVERLTASWRGEPGQDVGPVIREATDRAGRTIHVRVVWDEWAGIHARDRSQVILEALGRVRGADAESTVQAVMGLTPAELGRKAL